MFKIEESKSQSIPQTQYLRSLGTIVTTESESVITSYFSPSMIFPAHVELLSATLLCNNIGREEKVIHFSSLPTGAADPTPIPEYDIVHKAGDLYTTTHYKPSLILDPHQPFFFHFNGKLEDSCIVISYKNFDGNFGKRLKIPLK